MKDLSVVSLSLSGKEYKQTVNFSSSRVNVHVFDFESKLSKKRNKERAS